MKVSKLWMPLLGAAWLAMGLTGQVSAQPYPNHPIKLLVPFTPGGGTDQLARIVAQKMSENMGQQIIVDNRPGGNTLVATEAVVRAAPDGYTLIMQTNNLAANPTLHKGKITFDTMKDLVPVSLVAGNPHAVTTPCASTRSRRRTDSSPSPAIRATTSIGSRILAPAGSGQARRSTGAAERPQGASRPRAWRTSRATTQIYGTTSEESPAHSSRRDRQDGSQIIVAVSGRADGCVAGLPRLRRCGVERLARPGAHPDVVIENSRRRGERRRNRRNSSTSCGSRRWRSICWAPKRIERSCWQSSTNGRSSSRAAARKWTSRNEGRKKIVAHRRGRELRR